MKKISAILLALVLAVGLCACTAQTEDPHAHIKELLEKGDYDGAISAIEQLKPTEKPTGSTGETQNGEQPSTKEKELLRLYTSIARALESYVEDGFINIYDSGAAANYTGVDALTYCYEQLKAMDGIDQWLQTDEWVGKGVELDREKLIKGFDIVADVLLLQKQTVTDNLGNVSTNSNQVRWHYNGNSTLARVEGGQYLPEYDRFAFSLGTIHYMYGIDDLLNKIQFGSTGFVNAMLTPEYDESGRLLSEYVETNDREYIYRYTYDDADRVVQIAWRHSNDQMGYLKYTYDEAGRVTKTVMEYVLDTNGLPVITDTREYVYGELGQLVSATYTETGWGHTGADELYTYSEKVDKAVFQCDDQGRVIKETITSGVKRYHDGTETKPEYTSQVLERVYGNYYHYNPLV